MRGWTVMRKSDAECVKLTDDEFMVFMKERTDEIFYPFLDEYPALAGARFPDEEQPGERHFPEVGTRYFFEIVERTLGHFEEDFIGQVNVLSGIRSFVLRRRRLHRPPAWEYLKHILGKITIDQEMDSELAQVLANEVVRASGMIIRSSAPEPSISQAASNLDILAELLGFTKAERNFCFHTIIAKRWSSVSSVLSSCLRLAARDSRPMEALLECNAQEFNSAYSRKSILFQAGVISKQSGSSDLDRMSFASGFMRAMHWNGNGSILDTMLRGIGSTAMTRDDYAHVGETVDILCRLLVGANERGATGVNILIHGAPGTGKTELARLIPQEIGARGMAAGEVENREEDTNRAERLRDLRLAEALLSRQERRTPMFLVFDEMEDLTRFQIGGGSKIVLNRFMETNRVPVVWIANNMSDIPDYVVRRMTAVLEIRAPSAQMQQRMLRKIASTQGVDLPEDDAKALQSAAVVIPAVARNAAWAASLAGGGPAEMKRFYLGVSSALQGREVKPDLASGAVFYRPDLSVTDIDLAALADRLASDGDGAVGLLFHGAPGTGKSAAARFMAERMGLPVMERRGSDIFGKYVGESEKAIRRIFREAEEEGAALIFDEIDSLLSDRRHHQAKHETSQVNEFLKALEGHDKPVFACTNLLDRMDAAAMRRFLLKVKFDVLDDAHARRAFVHYFGTEPPAGADLYGSVPSDFDVSRRKARFTGAGSPAEMLALVRAEMEARVLESRPIGFGRQA